MQVFRVTEGLKDYYEKSNPEFEDLQISNVRRLTDGWDVIVFRYQISYVIESGQKINKTQILRLFPGKDGKKKAKDEFNLLASMMLSTIQVPDPYRLEMNDAIIQVPFIIMEDIDGQLLSEYIVNQPKKSDYMAKNFARVLVEIHSLDWNVLVINAKNTAVDTPYKYLVQLLNDYKDKIELYDKKEFIPVLRWLVERMDQVPNDTLSLLHGDFHMANVIVDEIGDLFVIDWVKSEIGDFRVDLAWTLITHETVLGKELRDIIYLEYKENSELPVSDIEYFEVLAILRLLIDLSINFSFSNEASRLNPRDLSDIRENLEPIKKAVKILKGHTGISLPDIERMIE